MSLHCRPTCSSSLELTTLWLACYQTCIWYPRELTDELDTPTGDCWGAWTGREEERKRIHTMLYALLIPWICSIIVNFCSIIVIWVNRGDTCRLIAPVVRGSPSLCHNILPDLLLYNVYIVSWHESSDWCENSQHWKLPHLTISRRKCVSLGRYI